MDYTIAEEFTLPSLGKIYSQNVNPNIKLRSMTTREELKRQNPSERTYKPLCDIIDDCFVISPGISCYDLCIGDYLFLLHKIRIVTYGASYKTTITCPYCGCSHDREVDLDQIDVNIYTDDLKKHLEFDLPQTKKHIKLKFQTPRMLDDIDLRAKELSKKAKGKTDFTYTLTLEALIDTVDGVKLNPIELEDFVAALPMLDAQHIIAHSDRINESLGVDARVQDTCDVCKLEYISPFRITQEFFRPTFDF